MTVRGRKFRRCLALGAAIVLASSGAAGAQTCRDGTAYDQKKVEASIDRYFRDPFGAVSWRVLNGLGDPGLEASYVGESHWSDEQAWRELTAKIAPATAQQQYLGYNCRVGYALRLLKDRIASFGETHPYVRQWVTAQSAVFRSCSDDVAAVLPAPITIEDGDPRAAELRQLQVADRAYQQASIDFYRGSFDAALAGYRAIASGAGPHRAVARYMVANVLANAKRLDEARTEIDAILAEPGLADIHGITQELKGYLANLADTAVQWSALLRESISILERPAEAIRSDKDREDYRRALNDISYLGIRGRDDDWWLTGQLPENPTVSDAIYKGAREFPMVAWMIAGQTVTDFDRQGAWQLIGENWRKEFDAFAAATRALMPSGRATGLAWDVFDAATTNSTRADRTKLAARLVRANAEVRASCGAAPETAASGLLLHHTIRVLAERVEFAAAYDALKSYPFTSTRAFRYTLLRLGQFLVGQGSTEEGRRFAAAFLTDTFYQSIGKEDGEEFRRMLPRIESLLAANFDDWQRALDRHPRPSEDPLINFLSRDRLRELARRTTMSADERALFARVAWTRAYARRLDPEPAATEEMLSLNPAIAAVRDDVATSYPDTQDDYRWLLTIVRTPRFGILTTASGGWSMQDLADRSQPPTAIDVYDHNDKNWWCPFNVDRHLGELRDAFDEATGNGAARALGAETSFQVAGQWYRNTERFRRLLDPDIAKRLTAARESVLGHHPVVRTIDWKELRRLGDVRSGPRLLSEQAVQWARRGGRPKDGVTEALALGVKAARYGCSWAGSHKAYTQAAVGILQTMFKETEWAKRTPYWYDCLWQSYGPEPTSIVKRSSCTGPRWPRQERPR